MPSLEITSIEVQARAVYRFSIREVGSAAPLWEVPISEAAAREILTPMRRDCEGVTDFELVELYRDGQWRPVTE